MSLVVTPPLGIILKALSLGWPTGYATACKDCLRLFESHDVSE